MRKYYILFLFAIGLFSSNAQPLFNAQDDYFSTVNSSAINVVLGNILDNDSLIGNQVTITYLNPLPFSCLVLNPDGTIVFNGPSAQNMTYMIPYQICAVESPQTCYYATAYVSVGCAITPPIVGIIQQPNCSNPTGSVQLSGLPATGTWFLINEYDMFISSGTGSSTTINLNPGTYHLTVSQNSCYSTPVTISMNPISGITLNTTSTYEDYNADGITNVGDVINYQFSITNNGCTSVSGVGLDSNSASVSISGNSIASLAPGTTNSTAFSGTYIITQNDINNGHVYHSFHSYATSGITLIHTYDGDTENLSLSDGFKLIAFEDSNSNGIMDNGEVPFNSASSFTYEMNSNGIVHHINSNQPYYLYDSNPSNTYTISFQNNSFINSCYNVTPTNYNNINIPVGSGITSLYFPLIESSCSNLGAYIIDDLPARPGFNYQNRILIWNTGNQTIPSGTITFTKDNLLTITNITPAGSILNPTGFTYDFSNLLPSETRIITVNMLVPTIPNVALGDQLTNTVVATPLSDVNPLDNQFQITATIVGSYDPNDKQENHGGRIEHTTFTADDYLTYTIRFENTGTANAINVKVEDILDNQLDENTIRMVAASHDYVLDRVSSNLTWKFNGINLPPSVANTQIGHGFITFQIKPKAGYAIGDIIANTAEIYFDFNPAIVTNTCTTEFVETLSNESFAFANLTYFPNPVKNSLTISNTSLIETVEISTILGQNMLSRKINSLQTEIDLSALSSGIYFVKVTSEGHEKTIKIVKE